MMLNLKQLYFRCMEIIHVSAECYPVAKAGGLGDVVGALPKYQNKLGHIAKVVMPMYRTKFLYQHEFEVVHKGAFGMANYWFDYTIIKEATMLLGFDLYLVIFMDCLTAKKFMAMMMIPKGSPLFRLPWWIGSVNGNIIRILFMCMITRLRLFLL